MHPMQLTVMRLEVNTEQRLGKGCKSKEESGLLLLQQIKCIQSLIDRCNQQEKLLSLSFSFIPTFRLMLLVGARDSKHETVNHNNQT